MRKKIVILSNYPPDHVSFTGGIETATAALLEGLREYQNEFEFHLISTSKALPRDIREQRDGFRFHFLRLPNKPWVRPRMPFWVIKAYRELRTIMPPDLIHCQGNMALALAAVLGGHPRLFTLHGVPQDESQKRSGWEFWSTRAEALIQNFVLHKFDAYICISSYAARVIGNRHLCFAIPNPTGSLFFKAPAPVIIPARPRLLFIGVIAPLKRPADLLLAHETLSDQFPNLETLFCGEVEDTGYAQAIQELVAERRIQGVHFRGRIHQKELVELMRESNALILPSAQENSPMVIAEAFAVGIPVVATRVGGIPDMIRHGETGLLYEAGDVRALTDCLRQLLVDPPFQQRLGRNARKWAEENYLPARVAEKTIAVYRQLLNER